MTSTSAAPKPGSDDARRPELPLDVLLVDDEETIRVTLADDLKGVGHRVTAVGSGDAAIEQLTTKTFDVVVTDLRLPGADGLKVLAAAKERTPRTEVILITAYGTVETAVDAMHKGAFHFVLKPFLNDEILILVARVARMRQLELKNRQLTEQIGKLEGFEDVIVGSPAMHSVLEIVRTVAPTDASILIEGESGTGKEVIARAIHRNSLRRDGPFVALSCAALPESLLEAELFGHEKGAFTDARRERKGRFELATNGTLFLDDVDDLGLTVQVKLLRALQERLIERVGGEKAIAVDIRVVTATKKSLPDLMVQGRFREDLYYRLNVVPLKLPPLRDRVEDIPLLVKHFVSRLSRGRPFEITQETMEALCAYPWPGNVRELENSIERAIAMAGAANVLKAEHLLMSARTAKNAIEVSGKITSLREYVEQAEREHIIRVLRVTKNHKAQAAGLLGISRKSLWEKMRDYVIPGLGTAPTGESGPVNPDAPPGK